MIASVFCSSTAKLYEVHASEVAKYTNRQNGTLGTIRTSALYYVGDVLANGWVFHEQPVDGYYYLFYKDGVRLTGAGVDANNETRYYVNGILANGVYNFTGTDLLYEEGLIVTGTRNGKYYVNGIIANGWAFHKEPIDGKYYLFYKDGVRLTGAGVDANNEKRYYVNGILAEGNATFDGITRFYKEGISIDANSNIFIVNGLPANGWVTFNNPVNGKTRLFYVDGIPLTGKVKDNDGEHLFIKGSLAEGLQEYNGLTLLYENGDPVTGTRNGKYYVNGIIANGWAFHKEPIDGKYYLFYKDGVRLTGAGVDANNETRYYVNGILAQGLQTVSGEPRVYRDGLFANGWVNGIYALNGYYANGWVQMENGEEEYFEYGKSASPKTLRENYTNEEFIQVMAYYIRKYSAQYGIKVNSGILAQAILESNWGRSVLSAKYHNYFGLKAGPYWTGKSVNMATQEEYVPGTYTNIRDNFRAFNSLEEGVRGYFEFTKFPNYAKIKTATTPEEYLTYIKQAGYATSSTYVQNTMRVVQTYNLTKYD